MAHRKPLMAGNWKMTLDHRGSNALIQKIAATLTQEDYDAVEVVVLPSFTSLRTVQTAIEADSIPLRWGAQDVSEWDKGARTGEVSGSMLSALGCSYAVVGHNERRRFQGEDDTVVNAKVKAAYRAGLTPILCVGETAPVRDAGRHIGVTVDQLDSALAGLSAEYARSIVVAYEPVWAIGTGGVATGEQAQEMCAAIRAHIAKLYDSELAEGVRVIYGGSVKAGNAAGLMGQPDVDGGLVGAASTDPEEWTGIVRYRLAR